MSLHQSRKVLPNSSLSASPSLPLLGHPQTLLLPAVHEAVRGRQLPILRLPLSEGYVTFNFALSFKYVYLFNFPCGWIWHACWLFSLTPPLVPLFLCSLSIRRIRQPPISLCSMSLNWRYVSSFTSLPYASGFLILPKKVTLIFISLSPFFFCLLG